MSLMFGSMTTNFRLMPHIDPMGGKEYYHLHKSDSAETGVNFNNLDELKECFSLMAKVIRDVEKRVGLKDTHKKRV